MEEICEELKKKIYLFDQISYVKLFFIIFFNNKYQ